jgi:hypothetical protein
MERPLTQHLDKTQRQHRQSAQQSFENRWADWLRRSNSAK